MPNPQITCRPALGAYRHDLGHHSENDVKMSPTSSNGLDARLAGLNGSERVMNGTGAASGAQSSSRAGPSNVTAEGARPGGALLYEADRAWSTEGAASSSSSHVPLTMPVDREEVVRLMLQAMRDAGYRQAAETLETESGYRLSSPSVTAFQASILGGRWFEALALLPDLGLKSTEASEQAHFLVARQKYLELLETDQQKKALAVLRGELAPVAKEAEKLHELSGFMMCLDRDDLYTRAGWDGAEGSSRRLLLDHLQEHVSPSVMLPSRRLATLLDQARRHQQLQCLYHSDPEAISLYTDHKCADGLFPTVTTHVLADHTDEIWRIEWSPTGEYLASASKDKTVIIWLLQRTLGEDGSPIFDCAPFQHLRDHHEPVGTLAWSPDGARLVTAAETVLHVWDPKTGIKLTTITSKHADTISAVQWKPDGSGFIVASKDSQLIFYLPDGTASHGWDVASLQIEDFVIGPDSKTLFATALVTRRTPVGGTLKPATSASNDSPDAPSRAGPSDKDGQPTLASMSRRLMVLNLETHKIESKQTLKSEASSIKVSDDGTKLLLGLGPDEVQLWTYNGDLTFVRRYKGHDQSRFLIRSCFGAAKDKFVLSGSEDCNVYVWHAHSAELLEVLVGHTDTVNGVAWSPNKADRLFASCSDDGTIRIWQPAGVAEALSKRPRGLALQEEMEL